MKTDKNVVEMNRIFEGDEFKVLIEGQYYRVTNISKLIGVNDEEKLVIDNLPLLKGLAIEEKLNDESYQVVNNCVWDKCNKKVILEDFNFNAIDSLDPMKRDNVTESKMSEYISTIQFARQTLLDIHEDD